MQNYKGQRILGTEDQFTEKGIRYAWNSLAIVQFMSKDQKSMSLKLSFSSGTTIARVHAKRANNCSCFFVVISFHCSVPVFSSENKKGFRTHLHIYILYKGDNDVQIWINVTQITSPLEDNLILQPNNYQRQIAPLNRINIMSYDETKQ